MSIKPLQIKAVARHKIIAVNDKYYVKNDNKYMKGSFGGGGSGPSWVLDKTKASKFSKVDVEKSAKMRGYKLVKV
jgi:hypothetical protein